MESVSEQRRQKDRILGLIGSSIAILFLHRIWAALLSPKSVPPTAPSTMWFVVSNATLLALFAWSVGRFTGHYYNRKASYRLVVGVLSTIGIGAALVFVGYMIATYPGHL